MPTKPVPLCTTALLLRHGPLEDPLQPDLIYLPEITLDAVHQHHRYLFGVTFAQLRQVVHQLFRPLKSQRGSNPPDGVARVCAQVTVCFGDQDNLRFSHG